MSDEPEVEVTDESSKNIDAAALEDMSKNLEKVAQYRAESRRLSIECDEVLQFYVHGANAGRWTFDLTLDVGGVRVSGTLMGRKAWFEELGEDVTSKAQGDAPEDYTRTLFTAHGDMGDNRDLEEHFPEPWAGPRFIHLRDAFVWTPGMVGGLPAVGEGFLWRGRIDLIAGWNMGTISRE